MQICFSIPEGANSDKETQKNKTKVRQKYAATTVHLTQQRKIVTNLILHRQVLLAKYMAIKALNSDASSSLSCCAQVLEFGSASLCSVILHVRLVLPHKTQKLAPKGIQKVNKTMIGGSWHHDILHFYLFRQACLHSEHPPTLV